MKKSFVNLINFCIEKCGGTPQWLGDGEDMRLSSEIKIDFYGAYNSLLQERITLKREKIKIYKAVESDDELTKIEFRETVIREQLEIMDLQFDMLAKQDFIKIYTEHTKYGEEKDKQLIVEIAKNSGAIMQGARELLEKNIDDKVKAVITGLLHQWYNGAKTIREQGKIYEQLKDLVVKHG
jgi:hypothetical protein